MFIVERLENEAKKTKKKETIPFAISFYGDSSLVDISSFLFNHTFKVSHTPIPVPTMEFYR